ncbi:peptidoglycan DD-metalloendopeptidase family protein [Oerskovia sp. Root22]|uniref:peptidoglycan DD-metalloendopeptidase family protein n=1 Tax=Oerskovia sp. Root22 TaxID=1736494 RepID=UPI000AD59966|nr:peptidoglycan DD-metalloendopeptidase family protein [Oerskovia sp. Root22]
MPAILSRSARLSAVVAGALALALVASPAPLALGGGAGPPASDPWVAPVAGDLVVLRPFLPPDQDWLAGHRGVDLGASPGAAVVAPDAGVVTFVGTVVDRGVVVVLHDDGLRTSLEPVAGSVGPGTRVARGEVVGTLESGPDGGGGAAAGHCVPASCLHWGVRRGEHYLDPLALLAPREPIVLLPLR